MEYFWCFNIFMMRKLIFHPFRALQLVSRPSKVTPPFPQIFSQSLNDRGLQDSHLLPTNREFLQLQFILCSEMFVVLFKAQLSAPG